MATTTTATTTARRSRAKAATPAPEAAPEPIQPGREAELIQVVWLPAAGVLTSAAAGAAPRERLSRGVTRDGRPQLSWSASKASRGPGGGLVYGAPKRFFLADALPGEDGEAGAPWAQALWDLAVQAAARGDKGVRVRLWANEVATGQGSIWRVTAWEVYEPPAELLKAAAAKEAERSAASAAAMAAAWGSVTPAAAPAAALRGDEIPF